MKVEIEDPHGHKVHIDAGDKTDLTTADLAALARNLYRDTRPAGSHRPGPAYGFTIERREYSRTRWLHIGEGFPLPVYAESDPA